MVNSMADMVKVCKGIVGIAGVLDCPVAAGECGEEVVVEGGGFAVGVVLEAFLDISYVIDDGCHIPIRVLEGVEAFVEF